MDYRSEARKSLARAKLELDSSNEHRLRYAALELRMALEALIYEKAGQYKEELCDKKLSTWQPKVLLDLLLEIDPYADKSTSLAVGIEEEYGKPAKQMTLLGKDRVLGLGEIKKYYARLGSYLHALTIDQSSEGKGPTPDKIRTSCGEIVKIIDEVLASPVFNVNIKTTSSITCQGCGEMIVRRIHSRHEPLTAKCIKCPASYTLIFQDDGATNWKPNILEIKCANTSCRFPINVWVSEIKIGTNWKCSECNGNNTIVHGIVWSNLETKK